MDPGRAVRVYRLLKWLVLQDVEIPKGHISLKE